MRLVYQDYQSGKDLAYSLGNVLLNVRRYKDIGFIYYLFLFNNDGVAYASIPYATYMQAKGAGTKKMQKVDNIDPQFEYRIIGRTLSAALRDLGELEEELEALL